MAGGRADGMTEAEWRALPSEVECRQIGDVTHDAEHLALPFGLERSFQFSHAVEMIFDRLLVGAGDDHDVVDTGCDSLFDNPLDRRAVDHREHLLRHGLGGGRKRVPSPAAGITAVRTLVDIGDSPHASPVALHPNVHTVASSRARSRRMFD